MFILLPKTLKFLSLDLKIRFTPTHIIKVADNAPFISNV